MEIETAKFNRARFYILYSPPSPIELAKDNK